MQLQDIRNLLKKIPLSEKRRI